MKIKLIASVVALAIATSANADTGITGFTGGNPFASFSGVPVTVGYQFTVNQTLNVTALGLYDLRFGGGSLQFSHDVGIFTNAGALLASTTVLPSSTLVNGYRFVGISPLVLTAGQTYLIGGHYTGTGPTDDAYISGATSVTTSPAITFNQSSYFNSGSLAAPTNLTGSNGRFGPNFQFTLANGGIPEPSTWALLIGGFGAVGFAMRRRRVRGSVSFA